jgi:hypothetical protein
MKVRFTIVILTLMCFIARGQEKRLTADSDTIYWQSYYRAILIKTGVDLIEKTNNEFVFRFWDGIKLIELKNTESTGTVTFILQQYKNKKEGRLYSKRTVLNNSTTKLLKDMLDKYELLQIPTYSQIKGWDGGLDGKTYITEYADKTKYSFKTYWSPDSYKDKLIEAGQLTDFISELDKIGEIEIMQKKFMTRQPFSSWYTFIGSARVASKTY